MRRGIWWWAGAVAFVILLGRGAEAEVPTFALDLAAAPAVQDVSISVRSPSQIPFKIIHTGGALGGSATLDITPFINDQGVVQLVTISVGGAAQTDQVTGLDFNNPVLTANLNIPSNLPLGGKYTGRLILTAPGLAQPINWRFFLTSVDELRPATLVLDRNAVTVSATRPLCVPFFAYACVGGKAATVTVDVRDKTGNAPLRAVRMRLDPGAGGAASAGLSIEPSDIRDVTFNRQPIRDMFASAVPDSPRDVEAGGQGIITLRFNRVLDAGAYTIPLRFTAANSGDDDLQRLTVTLNVHDSVYLAALILVLAAILSFLATRVVTMMRQRASFMARVHALRPAWLAQEPKTLPVIGLQAMLQQSEALSKRFWLTGQNQIDARLTAAERMLAILSRVHKIRIQIDEIPDAMVKQRAGWKLDKFVDERLDATPLAEQDATRLNAELDQFNDWCGTDLEKQTQAYWTDVASSIDAVLSRVERLCDQDAQSLADGWVKKLKASLDAKPAIRDEMWELDRVYRRLALLWESRRHPDWVSKIVSLHPPKAAVPAAIDDVYRVVDDGWWEALQHVECTAKGPPPSMLDPPEAFETVQFSLGVIGGDEGLAASFLVRRKLHYHWTITITPRSWNQWFRQQLGRKPITVTEEVESVQPRAVEYSPCKGDIAVSSVAVTYRGAPGGKGTASEPVRVVASSDFGIWRKTERADYISFLVAMLLSLVSGIKLYALGATFGSLADYLALFTWGAGVDQGKTFLQSLAAYSSGAPATSGSGSQASGAQAK
jgi:hypothetical protein